LFEACSPNSDLGRAQKSLGSADLVILTEAVEVVFKSMSVKITKSNRLVENTIFFILVTCVLLIKQIASYL